MEERRLRDIFASLAQLAQQGPLPVQAYSSLLRGADPSSLAESLHQRWLTDAQFAPIAADLLLHIYNVRLCPLADVFQLEHKDNGLSRDVLALLLNDYRSGLELRSYSQLMYRNCTRALFSLYPVFVKIDECVSRSLVKPMFTSLRMLLEACPDADDLLTAIDLLCLHGLTLQRLNAFEVERLMVGVREALCSDWLFVDSIIRRRLLHVLDLWGNHWDANLIPEIFLPVGVSESPSPSEKAREEWREEPKENRLDISETRGFGSKESVV